MKKRTKKLLSLVILICFTAIAGCAFGFGAWIAVYPSLWFMLPKFLIGGITFAAGFDLLVYGIIWASEALD